MPLPPINVSSKLWFAHRHKAAGHSVAAELNEIVAGGCASLTVDAAISCESRMRPERHS